MSTDSTATAAPAVLLAADKTDLKDAGRSGPTDVPTTEAILGHDVRCGGHIDRSCSGVSDRRVVVPTCLSG
jgi:hypothetical protein